MTLVVVVVVLNASYDGSCTTEMDRVLVFDGYYDDGDDDDQV